MPLKFTIIPAHDVVYVRYIGNVRADEPIRGFQSYCQHPDFRQGQRQLFDLSEVKGAQLDLARINRLHDQMIETLLPSEGRLVLVFYTPTKISHSLGQLLRKSWEPYPVDFHLIEDSESKALELLQIDLPNFASLEELAAADH